MFLSKKKHSKDFAKDRLKTVLLSERVDCSPQLMIMMKNDIIQAVSKYLPVDEKNVNLRYVAAIHLLDAQISIHNITESERES